MTSVLATAVGVGLMFGRGAAGFAARGVRRALGRPRTGPPGALKGPHQTPRARNEPKAKGRGR